MIARDRSDLVILTGGLGPTEDDSVLQTLAQFLGRDLDLPIQKRWAKLDQASGLPVGQTMSELPTI
ncbi:MAG: molybdopterin-binding protein [Streptococcus parasanguinis]